MPVSQNMSIESLVSDVKQGRILRPEIQRQYVWKSTQVRDFFDSLYRQYPSGQILLWETSILPETTTLNVAGLSAGLQPRLLLDGQQRLTSLVKVFSGQPIKLRDDEREFDIVFNLYREVFEVARGPIKHGLSGWYSLSKFFTSDPFTILSSLTIDAAHESERAQIAQRLAKLNQIRTYHYNVTILQDDMDYQQVTDIFVRINSGGTRLSNADLAQAQVSALWSGMTREFEVFSDMIKAQFQWDLDHALVLRCLIAIVTSQSYFSKLFRGKRGTAIVSDLKAAWDRVQSAIKKSLHFITTNCAIDRLSMLPSGNVIIPLVYFFDRYQTPSQSELSALRRWLYMAIFWSRYSTSVETKLDQDIATLNQPDSSIADMIARMIQHIEDQVGRRPVTERELQKQSKNSAAMLFCYLLVRRANATDPFNGLSINAHSGALEYYPIFASNHVATRDSRVLYEVANIILLTERPSVRSRNPAVYLINRDQQFYSQLAAQRVPVDPELLDPEHFEDFLLERRRLLAQGINELLESSLDAVPNLLEVRIKALEQTLRDAVAARLELNHGNAAFNRIPPDVRGTLMRHKDRHESNHPYEGDESISLTESITFCMFSDYAKIIKTNWDDFADLFGDQQKFEREIPYIIEARNAIFHGNPLNASQMAHAEGALTWFENCMNRDTLQAESDEQEAQVVSR